MRPTARSRSCIRQPTWARARRRSLSSPRSSSPAYATPREPAFTSLRLVRTASEPWPSALIVSHSTAPVGSGWCGNKAPVIRLRETKIDRAICVGPLRLAPGSSGRRRGSAPRADPRSPSMPGTQPILARVLPAASGPGRGRRACCGTAAGPDARWSRMSRAAAMACELASRLACGVRRAEDDKACVWSRREPHRGWRDRHAPRRSRHARGLWSRSLSNDLGMDLVAAGRQQLIDEFPRTRGNRRLRPVPVAGALDVEVGRSVGEAVESVAVGRDRLPGSVQASLTRWISTPRFAEPALGADARNTARAARRAAPYRPRFGKARSTLSGTDDGPSMSVSMIGCHAWSRLRVSSDCTAASSSGTRRREDHR